MIIRVKYQVFVGCGIAIDRSKNNTLEEAKQVVSLIRSQHNLIYFELFNTHQEGMSEILKSLKETQHMYINYNSSVFILPKIFSKFTRIEVYQINVFTIDQLRE
ncbi:hypothetical protein C1645_838410 [Glomus cerebriforme]|uniref:Uncharacterized protein n=1 Tax=Glomus cerebriforme TaxID=658196 RepID=A0A397SDX6_9GLOM|nr:hypothetical protein C1645_838410 [Glomus cerebriforme]